MLKLLAVLAVIALPVTALAVAEPDPYLWLEEVDSERALAWVRAQNARTGRALGGKEQQALHARLLAILDSVERIPTPGFRGGLVYNFWQDERHERGLLRRTTLQSYRGASPEWETVLDVDALGRAEGVPWVYKGSTCLGPEERRCMVSLSRGGADAVEQRELDTVARAFVAGGFRLPEAKSTVAYKDEDTLWVATDFGPGSLTTSGYPRVVKEWRRGTPLASARTLLEVPAEEVGAWPFSIETPGGRFTLITRLPRFYVSHTYLGLGGRLVRLPFPEDAELNTIFHERVLVTLRSEWRPGARAYPGGALLACDLDSLLQGQPAPELLWAPSERVSLQAVTTTRDHVLVTTLDTVHSRLHRLSFGPGGTTSEEIPLPGQGVAEVVTTRLEDDVFFYSYEDFLTPPSLYLQTGSAAERVRALPLQFEAKGVQVEQRWAVSKDGTRVPYFLVLPAGFVADGTCPTVLYGYGGFEEAELPRHTPTVGAAWLERGGAWALANIRGGGEFGPAWHQAALKANRIKSFEDFIAVAEDLLARRVTSRQHLGIMGGSQGGLLVGGAFTLRPDLFGAVVCQIPLLDMRRYHRLLAGASWMAEYGDPDRPEEWATIRTWSPYHLLRKDVTYPGVLLWTTHRDDRVHPGHARKMAARMAEMGHDVLFFEGLEGGHGTGAVSRQKAEVKALEWAFLSRKLR